MTPPRRRDHGLSFVRKATIWIAGGAVIAVGAFAALLGRPTGAGAGTGSSSVGSTIDGTSDRGATTPSTNARAGSSPTTVAPSGRRTTPTTISPPAQAPRSSRRRPSVSSGGS
jgi:hypothetical protein